MAQTYTLDEAAARLGITAEEFKRRLRDDWKGVRSFRDGATLRFRAVDIDELARTLGQASDPGLQLGAAAPLTDSSEELSLDPPKSQPKSQPRSKPKSGSGKNLGQEHPLYLGDDSDDVFALPADESAAPKSKPKGKGDSDVRLDATPRRDAAGGNQPTEEIELELPPPSGVGLGKSSAKLTPPKSSGRVSKIPGAGEGSGDDGSSEFELSLDSDSDSFELQLSNDSSEESALGGDLPASGGVQSGINLGKPSDSGVSLEKKGSKPKGGSKPPVADESDADFELSLDPPSGGGPRSKPIHPAVASDEGSSEFELTLDDSDSESMNRLAAGEQQSGDIFETDFELPVMAEDESGSEVLQVDSADTDLENSDFDLAIDAADAPADDESASQVVLMDDDQPVALEEEPVVLDDEEPVVIEDEEDMATVAGREQARGRERVRTEVVEKVIAPPPPRWGILPTLALAPTFLVVVFGGLMAFEVVRSMAGYQQPTASPIVRGVAKTFNWSTGD